MKIVVAMSPALDQFLIALISAAGKHLFQPCHNGAAAAQMRA